MRCTFSYQTDSFKNISYENYRTFIFWTELISAFLRGLPVFRGLLYISRKRPGIWIENVFENFFSCTEFLCTKSFVNEKISVLGGIYIWIFFEGTPSP